MGKLLQRLTDAGRSGVYRADEAVAIEDALTGIGIEPARISLEGIRTKAALLERLAGGLRLPEWFGGNWDALEDCLTDLSWRDEPAHVLLFDGADPSDALGVLLDILRSSAEYWQARGTPFFAIFVDRRNQLPLPALYHSR